MLPRVLYHVAASLDGRVDHISPDLGQFYGLAAAWGEDCTLTGADTLLAAPAADAAADDRHDEAPGDVPGKPLLAVVDSRGRIPDWRPLTAMTAFWRAPVALMAERSPSPAFRRVREAGVEAIVAGHERVDLRLALERLAEAYGVTRVRVDSGGSLAGALLRAGLVHEVSVLVQPRLVGGRSPRSLFNAPDLPPHGGALPLSLTGVERLGQDVVWLRYDVSPAT